ncbi:MAG TPA: lysylphosphatidylglycerol synthase transmembrane domain-containing protein [Bacteroidota bacterium]
MNRKKRVIWIAKWLLRPILVLLLTAILWHYFSGLQFSLVVDRIRGIGPAALLILLPYGFVFLVESFAWRLAIRRDPPPGIGLLLLVRVATDALLYSIPGGVAIAEPMRPVLLKRECGVDMTEGIGSCIITKINIAVAQAVFMLIGFSLVILLYPGVAARLGPGEGAKGFAVIALSLFSVVALLTLPFSGPRMEQVVRTLARIPLRPLRSFLAKGEPYILRLDEHVGRFARDHTGKFALSLLLSFSAWVLVGVESFLILKFLGADPTFTQAVALESTASLFRIVFFFLPGGIGASEVGFVALLVAFGFPDPVTLSAAYIAVKRLKEAGWIMAGYLIFWFIGFNPFRKAERPAKS